MLLSRIQHTIYIAPWKAENLILPLADGFVYAGNSGYLCVDSFALFTGREKNVEFVKGSLFSRGGRGGDLHSPQGWTRPDYVKPFVASGLDQLAEPVRIFKDF